MTTSTHVERRRLRARLAHLTLSTILCSGLAAPAWAESPHPNLDANGVDLTDGSFNLRLPVASIGSGQAELPLVAYSGSADNWSNIYLYQSVAGSVTTVNINLGTAYDTFSSADGFAASARGTGATLSIGDGTATYRTLAGITIEFGNLRPDFPGGTSNFCRDSGSANCTLLPLTIDGKAGMTVAYSWDMVPNCTSPQEPDTGATCNEQWRLRGVSNSAGYSITWTFANETGAPVPAWFRKTTATFGNANVTGGQSPVVTYGYPAAAVTTLTTPSGKTWRIAGYERVTGVRRPSASADTTSIAYNGGIVTSVTADGVTTRYARTVAGTTATMVVTDAQDHATTIVSDMTKFRPTSMTDGLGRVTSLSYDSVGRPTEIVYPEGNKQQFGYDAAGRTTRVTAKAKPGSGLADIVTSAGFASDCPDATCPAWSIDALGRQTDYSYDSATGLLASVTAPAAAPGATRPQTRYSYTSVAGVSVMTGVSTCRTGTAPACVGTADEVMTTTSYDTNLNLTSSSSGAGDGSLTATTAASYDARGNRVTVDGPLAGSADTISYRYDADRAQTGVISPDPDGSGSRRRRAIRYSYDSAGQLWLTALGTVAGETDADWTAFAEAYRQYSQYDGNGRDHPADALVERRRLRRVGLSVRCVGAADVQHCVHEPRRVGTAGIVVLAATDDRAARAGPGEQHEL